MAKTIRLKGAGTEVKMLLSVPDGIIEVLINLLVLTFWGW